MKSQDLGKNSSWFQKLLGTYTQPAFLICVIVLVAACSFMSVAIEGFAGFVKKTPLPLKKPLDLLSENALGYYKVISKKKIQDKYILKELGTEDYIEWKLEDTSVSPDSTVRICSLLITYYRLPDSVPHVPDECYIGVGYQRLAGKNLDFTVNMNGKKRKLPGRAVIFSGEGPNHWSSQKFQVLYLFRVNGEYCSSRESARMALDKNLFGKHSFFSKVEWRFFKRIFGSESFPSTEESIEASAKLLEVILPILEKEHWPDWTE
ncbi:hypothetical protein ACFL1G_02670 [Planctomycetota bacterium]